MSETSETKMLVELYGRHYLERFREPATILWPRDMGVSAKLLKIHPFAKLAQWVREFIWSDDKQIAEGGRSFPQFQYHLSRIITASSHSRTVKLLKGIYYDAEQTRSPIRDCVALLSVNFRADMEAPQTRSYERALRELAEQPEILMQAAELLIDEAANGRQFYPVPKPSDVKGACAKVIEVLRLEAFTKGTTGCTHPRYLEEITREDGSTVLQRCSCWKRGKQAMEAVAQPLALPESSRMEPIVPEVA